MPWPRKIATAKPHERPKPFDAWYFTAKAKTIADMPMCTEVLKRVCKDDPVLFDIVNQHLEDAFNAGRKSVEQNYEKRRFIEAACMAMIHAQTTRESYSRIHVRDVVNKAVELYDEIEHQVPNKEEDR